MKTDSPSVLCVMLTRNARPQMMRRAIRSFHLQSYPEKTLLIFHSGPEILKLETMRDVHVTHMMPSPKEGGVSIGSLRNLANSFAIGGVLNTELIAHWDDDDWSHPERLTEQVALMEKSGADCVGYGEMLFWEQVGPHAHIGTAYLYTNPNPAYCMGTSLLYSRKIWQKYPFPDRQTGEDTLWLHEKRIKRASVTAQYSAPSMGINPRMIASLHSGNTSSAIVPGAKEWQRVPGYDQLCREAMKL